MVNPFNNLDGATSVAPSNTKDIEDGNAFLQLPGTISDNIKGKGDAASDALVAQAVKLADTVDAALDRVIEEGNIKEYGGIIDSKHAAIAYTMYVVTTNGVEGAARILGIAPDVIQKLSAFSKYFAEAGSIISETPKLVPLAAVVWGIKKMGGVAANKLSGKFAGTMMHQTPNSWNKVGWSLSHVKGIPRAVSQAIAFRGGHVVALITAYIYRSEIYGVGKAIYDSIIAEDAKGIDDDLFNAGDPNNPKPLNINPDTGEVTFRNSGGKIDLFNYQPKSKTFKKSKKLMNLLS